MVTFSGSFTNEDLKGDTGRKDPVDEVIDILTAPTVGSGPPRGAPARAMRNVSAVSPKVNVQQLESLTPTYQGSNVPVGSLNTRFDDQRIDDIVMENLLNKAVGMEPTTTPYKSFIPAGPIGLQERYNLAGKVPSPSNMLSAMGSNFSDFMSGDVNPISTAPYTGIEQILARQAQAGQGDAYKDFFFEEGLREPSIFDPLQSLAQKALGYPEGMRGLYQMEQDKQVAMARNQELEDERRKDQERAERAAMLAAQQQQPVDPCPEGYRMDPVTKVCVPTDDTTQPDNLATRTYDTMTRPEPNYTPATNFNIPAITLPDILTGN